MPTKVLPLDCFARVVPEHLYWGTGSSAVSPFYLPFLAVSCSHLHLGAQQVQEATAAFPAVITKGHFPIARCMSLVSK